MEGPSPVLPPPPSLPHAGAWPLDGVDRDQQGAEALAHLARSASMAREDDDDVTASEGETRGSKVPRLRDVAGGGPSKSRGAMKQRMCQVDGCPIDLLEPHIKNYNRRNRVCEAHMKGLSAVVNGIQLRYCQQCHTFHALERFDGTKQSCRAKLEARAVHVKGAKEKQRVALAAVRGHRGSYGDEQLDDYGLTAAAAAPYHSRHMRAHAMGGGGMDGMGHGLRGHATDLMYVHPNHYHHSGMPHGLGGGAHMDSNGLGVMGGTASAGSESMGGGGGSSQLLLVQAMRQQTAAHLRGAQLQGNVAVAEVLRQQTDLLAQLHDNEVLLSSIMAEGSGGAYKAQVHMQVQQQQQMLQGGGADGLRLLIQGEPQMSMQQFGQQQDQQVQQLLMQTRAQPGYKLRVSPHSQVPAGPLVGGDGDGLLGVQQHEWLQAVQAVQAHTQGNNGLPSLMITGSPRQGKLVPVSSAHQLGAGQFVMP
ncbi:hypothetical protein FOA52_004589 [Chlamydomonas sp. UWO 241]|nr:hypothetical protein FOA52_004589 [Chlamydomonas sp. UWO 241]